LAVATLCAPLALVPRRSVWLIGARWRLAYAIGFVRGAWRTRREMAGTRPAMTGLERRWVRPLKG
jgi:hypothetical protein